MNWTELEKSPLLQQFHSFYKEILSKKNRIEAEIRKSGDDFDEGSNPLSEIFNDLLSILENQALESARWGGEYGASVYRDAQYVMAIFADEIFININWEKYGHLDWQEDLLENRLFGTHVSGTLFFEKIDTLLKGGDTSRTEMAAIYHLAISLGFQGKYRGTVSILELDEYRKKLYAYIFQKKPVTSGEENIFFPEAYEYTLDQWSIGKLPHVMKWMGVVVCLFIICLAASHLVWLQNTDVINEYVNNIISPFPANTLY